MKMKEGTSSTDNNMTVEVCAVILQIRGSRGIYLPNWWGFGLKHWGNEDAWKKEKYCSFLFLPKTEGT